MKKHLGMISLLRMLLLIAAVVLPVSLTPLPHFAGVLPSANRLQGESPKPQDVQEISIDVVSTGFPTGNIATATIVYTGTGPRTVEIPATVTTTGPRHQRPITCTPVTVTVTTPRTTVPLYGYCLDADLPTSPAGTHWPPSGEWDVSNPMIERVRLWQETFDRLREDGQIKTPLDFNPALERDVVVQFTLWWWSIGSEFDPCDRIRKFCDSLERELTPQGGGLGSPVMAIPHTPIIDAVILTGQQSGTPLFQPPTLPETTTKIAEAPPTSHPEIANTASVISTSFPNGHIADIHLSNPTDQTVEVHIGNGPLYIPGNGDQPQRADPIPPVIIAPGGHVTIPVYGSCVDIHVLPTEAGGSKENISSWIGLPGLSPETPPVKDPGRPGIQQVFIPTRTSMPLNEVTELLTELSRQTPQSRMVPCLEAPVRQTFLIPGTGAPLYFPINPEKNPGVGVSLVLNAYEHITRAYETLVESGQLSTVLAGNPERQRETVVQWALWQSTEALYGHPLPKEHWDSVGRKEIEKLSGKKLDSMPEPERKSIQTGLDGIWNAFSAVSVESKMVSPPVVTTPTMTTPGITTTVPVTTTTPLVREYVPTSSTYSKPPPETEWKCDPVVRVLSGPRMDGGLEPPNDSVTIYRDEFLPLLAAGVDYDELWWDCNPELSCPETPSTDMRSLNGRVKFEWRILRGEGSLVELGCLNPQRFREGKRVVFMPPYVAIDSMKETLIELKIIDDNPSQVIDETVTRNIRIRTRRDSLWPDHYLIRIESDAFRIPSPSQYTGLPRGSCLTQGPRWSRAADLPKPRIVLPPVEDNRKMVYKEWMRISADDIRDPDDVEVWCRTSCPTKRIHRSFEDAVEYEWTILRGGGRFIKGNKGRHVIYEAPEQAGEVLLKVDVYNPDFLKVQDTRPQPDTVRIEVFRPGVRMDTTATAWLPRDGIELEKRSYLVYEDNREWKTALAHQCRIHFFELPEASNERGVCLNWPPYPTADTCKDLYIKKLPDRYEVFDSSMCSRWVRGADDRHEDRAYYLNARTKTPVREFSVSVVSDDYGGFGFMRSVANGSKSTELPYKSVEWKAEEKTHPQGRPKKVVYRDNRVTIPKDIDENRIADRGWEADPNGQQADPEDPKVDADTSRNNNHNGDGIPAYEEYRGFFVRGIHRRFAMNIKDLLVWDRDNLGTGYFDRSHTGVEVRRIDQAEMDTVHASLRVINRNRHTHELGFDQKGARLYRSDGIAGFYGYTYNAVDPGDDGLVTCDSVSINVVLATRDAVVFDWLIAHELSHAVSVRHHGEGIINGRLNSGDGMTLDGLAVSNTSRRRRTYPIACTGGLTSGMENCWMRYDNFISHCPVSAVLVNLNCRDGGLPADLSTQSINTANDNVVGSTLCINATGTGINAGNRCGRDASVGNCFSQIRISCQRP